MTVNVRMDGGAHTIKPISGGDLWVERVTHDLFEIGTVDSDGYASLKWASTGLTREELVEFKNRIELALQEDE